MKREKFSGAANRSPNISRSRMLTPRPRRSSKLVLAVREYARDVLKLNVGGSYASYSYVDRPDLTYVVVAAPKTELRPYTWWFLIVGSVPYKGYFSKARCRGRNRAAEGRRLRHQSAHFGGVQHPRLVRRSAVVPSARVTTKSGSRKLCFTSCFTTRSMSTAQGAFNESVANFIGHRAAIDFFRVKYGADSAEHKRALRVRGSEEREFGAFIAEVVRASDRTVQERDSARRQAAAARSWFLARSKAEWARRIADRPTAPLSRL